MVSDGMLALEPDNNHGGNELNNQDDSSDGGGLTEFCPDPAGCQDQRLFLPRG